MQQELIRNAHIINEGRQFTGSVLIQGDRIARIFTHDHPDVEGPCRITEADGLWLLPGAIDDQVHFREPGLTHKADIRSESRAAVAGGITSFMEMPNTLPQTISLQALEDKYRRAAATSLANYAFYLGATNDNLAELKKADPRQVCGIKVFMGSSTGNMLVDNEKALSAIFAEIPLLIAVHCEDESLIRSNADHYRKRLGDNIPIAYHPLIRSAEACYKSSSHAVALAQKYGSRLHILHLSTARELDLFESSHPGMEKRITAEACIHHLWFSDADYPEYASRIKWNPAVKTAQDRDALIQAVKSGKIDVIATDHAPHLLSEKEGSCLTAASGGPLVQHALVAMLQLVRQGILSLETVVEKMCHAPARLFRIEQRGFIREGYFADLCLVNPNKKWTVTSDNILSKCGWSPFEGISFDTEVQCTWVNGRKVFDGGCFDEESRGEALRFG